MIEKAQSQAQAGCIIDIVFVLLKLLSVLLVLVSNNTLCAESPS